MQLDTAHDSAQGRSTATQQCRPLPGAQLFGEAPQSSSPAVDGVASPGDESGSADRALDLEALVERAPESQGSSQVTDAVRDA